MSQRYEDVSPEFGRRLVDQLRGTLPTDLLAPTMRKGELVPLLEVLVPREFHGRLEQTLAVGPVEEAAWEDAIAQGSAAEPTRMIVVLDLQFSRRASLRLALTLERDTPAEWLDSLLHAQTVTLHFLDEGVDVEPLPVLVALDITHQPLDPFLALAKLAKWIRGV
jgi:hypothetical protein